MLHVLIDADALPRQIKDTVFRAAERTIGKVKWTLVANKRLYIKPELGIDMITVEKSPDEADDRIVDIIGKGDLVVSSDIPLASRAIKKGASALSPKGEFHSESSISARLATRNLMEQLRNEGVIKCGHAPFSSKDIQQFANRLDSFIAKRMKDEASSERRKSSPFQPPEPQ